LAVAAAAAAATVARTLRVGDVSWLLLLLLLLGHYVLVTSVGCCYCC